MQPRISLVTLGVTDVARATRFYEALGFVRSAHSTPEVSFFQAGGMVLSLWSASELAVDAGIPERPPGGVALAHNVPTRDEVARVLAEAEAAGARGVKPAADVSWGGHCGYFTDPDGHLWEVAFNPHWPLTGDGALVLPG